MTLAQPVRFVLVGAGGYAVNVGAFALLVGAGVAYVAGSVGAYFVSSSLMYLGNRYFTFRLGHAGLLPAYARYTAVGAVVAALTAATLAFLVEVARVEPTLGQGVGLLVATPVAFALNRRWTFRAATT